MRRETELNVLVPSRELLVKLAGEERPLGLRATAPKQKVLLEIFFDTPEGTLREHGMTCRLCQIEGELPAVVVTSGEGLDGEGITSRTMMKASAVGTGIFETLRGDSEAARQVQTLADPLRLRPQVALNIRRIQRVVRGGLLFRPVFELYFDVVTVQVGGVSQSYQEIHLRDLRPGGPEILDLAQVLRDKYHIFPDGLGTLQRGIRFLALARQRLETVASPVQVHVALLALSQNRVALVRSGDGLTIPTFRGSGEDAARALAADVTGEEDAELSRVGSTEPDPDGTVLEIWTLDSRSDSSKDAEGTGATWVPWHLLVENVGHRGFDDPALTWALLFLTRSGFEEQFPAVRERRGTLPPGASRHLDGEDERTSGSLRPEHVELDDLYVMLRKIESPDCPLDDRLQGISDLSRRLDDLFLDDPQSWMGAPPAEEAPSDPRPPLETRLNHVCVRVRGLTRRLRDVLRFQVMPDLKERGVRILAWNDLAEHQREAVNDRFRKELLAEPFPPVAESSGGGLILANGSYLLVVAPRLNASEEGGTLTARMIPPRVPNFIRVPMSRDVLPLGELIPENGPMLFPEEEVGRPFLIKVLRCGPERDSTGSSRMTADSALPATEAEAGATPGRRRGECPSAGVESALDVLRVSAGITSPESDEDSDRESLPLLTRVEITTAMPWATRSALMQALEAESEDEIDVVVRTDFFEVERPLALEGIDQALGRQD